MELSAFNQLRGSAYGYTRYLPAGFLSEVNSCWRYTGFPTSDTVSAHVCYVAVRFHVILLSPCLDLQTQLQHC